MLLQHRTIHPCFCRRTSHGIAHDAHRYFETIAKHLPHIIGYSGEITHTFGRSSTPRTRLKETELIHLGKGCAVPTHIVGFPSRAHVIEAQTVVVTLRKSLLCSRSLFHLESHVRLSTAQPHFAHCHIFEAFHLATSSNGQGSTLHRLRKHRPNAPFTTIVGNYLTQFFAIIAHHDVGTSISHTLNIATTALKHHTIGEERRKLQSAIIARDTFIHSFSESLRPTWIRMDAIAQPVGMRNEGLVEINEFYALRCGDAVYSPRDFSTPKFSARVETWMIVSNWRKAREDNPHFGIGLSQRVHECHIVPHKLIAEIAPISRIGVVDAEVNHGNISLKLHRISKLRLLEIGAMSVSQESGTRFAEVAHDIILAEHTLQLCRIGILLTIGNARAVGDAIAHASHAHHFASSGGESAQQQKKR